MALRVTNFLGGMDVRQATAVFALAIQMSYRQMEDGLQRTVLRAICESCLKSWAQTRGEPEPMPCDHCKGAGTIGADIETMQTCPICQGTGAR